MNSDKLYEGLQEEYLDTIFFDYEKVRLADVRYIFQYCEKNIPALMDIYKKWVNQHEYFVLEVRVRQPQTRSLENRFWTALKCSKRGNDVYSSRVKQRISALKEALSSLRKTKTPPSRTRNLKQTNMLYVTLTYDTSRCNMSNAWQSVGQEWDLFLAKIRSKYGKVSQLRCWEAYENGYCHIHALLVFHDHVFTSFLHTSRTLKNKDGTKKQSFRILRREKNRISKMWHSHIDVQAVQDIEQAVKNTLWYVGKNVTKNIDKVNEKELLTFVAAWYFQKRSFSMSKDIIDLILRICITQENSIIQSVQTTIEGEKFLMEFIFLGVELGSVIQIPPKQWIETWKKRPDWITALSM